MRSAWASVQMTFLDRAVHELGRVVDDLALQPWAVRVISGHALRTPRDHVEQVCRGRDVDAM